MTIKLDSEEQIYWNKWTTTRDPQAADVLVRKYMPLISYHVQRISVSLPKTVSKDDLRSLAFYGLYDALEKFDTSRDLKFDTYASFRIRGAILDGLRKEDWLPRGAREKTKKIDATIEKLEQKLMRNVTASDVAGELGMTEDEVHSIVCEGFFANVLSIDEHLSNQDNHESSIPQLKDEKTITPEEYVLKQELFKQLEKGISRLNEKEQLVLSLFYKDELTLTEIGQVMELSTSRISQIHSKAIYKLKVNLDKIVI